ncbi:MAG TPA: hypothetical protein VI911_00235 [Patescibacteria group bacterium]|nr:hypothetical protein [Patescibacteria group bacterium]
MRIVAVHELLSDSGKVVLCQRCNGKGWELSHLDFGDYPGDEEKIACSSCGGTGRIKTVSVVADIVVPFNWKLGV